MATLGWLHPQISGPLRRGRNRVSATFPPTGGAIRSHTKPHGASFAASAATEKSTHRAISPSFALGWLDRNAPALRSQVSGVVTPSCGLYAVNSGPIAASERV